MARSWDKVKAHAAATGLDEGRVAEIMAEMRERVRAHKLAEIRRCSTWPADLVAGRTVRQNLP
jgi:hypothetical protein